MIKNLVEPYEFTTMHLDKYADYLRQVEPRTESRAVRALLTLGGSRTLKLQGRYVEVYGPYKVMLNVDGISIYTRTYVTTDSDQMGQIYLNQEEPKVRRIGHDAMMEQDAVHIGYEADVTAHLLDTNGKKIGVTGLLDTGAVVSVMPIKTWERMGFRREDLIPHPRSNLRGRKDTNNGPLHGRTRSLLGDSKQVCLVPNPNGQSSVILGRSFSITRNGLCASVLLNTLDTTVRIHGGKKLGYALPLKINYEETQNLKRSSVKDCPNHADKDNILKRIDEFNSINKLFSMKFESNDGLLSCSNFPERPLSYKLESDKPVLPEIEHLRGKIGEGDFESWRAVHEIGMRTYFQNVRRTSVAATSSNTK